VSSGGTKVAAEAAVAADAAAPAPPRALAAPEARAAVSLRRLVPLLAQLGLLLGVFHAFDVEGGPFRRLAAIGFAGFLVHYLTPLPWKKWVFVGLSLAGGAAVLAYDTGASGAFAVLLPASAVGLAFALGASFFAILRLAAPFWLRLVLVGAIAGLLAWMRVVTFLPGPFFLVLGSIFMFRMILYAYEVKVARRPESFADFCSYFFLLPNFYFVLFPVIDYSTFKKSFYARDIHDTAQRGIAWMVRGTTHLVLYRWIYHNLVIGPESIDSPATLAQFVAVPFWLYLKVSGHFHVIVGMLHLFGYSLPETNRRYFLASSFTDFWRRINIYWKDFMIKAFYYPAYFRFRRRNETLALVVATVLVFVATTLLHGYQMFWLHGTFTITSADLAFWGILGALVVVNALSEARRPRRPAKRSRAAALAARVPSTLAVYLTITVLWSLWSGHSVGDWVEAVTYWR
jgi:D-alanyl-lipoteichoic acid acyltransferase DltB (MBOAT superfamily)